MHGLVAIQTQNGCPENFLCIGIHDYFYESARLAKFPRTADTRHHSFTHQRPPARFPHFSLGHANPPERRVDEEAETENTVCYLAAVVIK